VTTAVELWEKMLRSAHAESPDERWRLDRADFVAVVQPLLDEIAALRLKVEELEESQMTKRLRRVRWSGE
jgi:hypothetical protein